MEAVMSLLVGGDPAPLARGMVAWWLAARSVRERFAHTLERALALGLTAPSVGCAFVGGYHAALGALVPTLGVHERVALCATEDGGAHPRAIATRLTASPGCLTLDGHKRFVTAARQADSLLVLATEGTSPDGRSRLALVLVPASADGVRFEDMPELPFAPDVSHSAVSFTSVRLPLSSRLDGDGWSDYVKPFRTLEDLHVNASLSAWLLGVLRRHHGPSPMIERLAAHALSLRALSDLDVSAPSTHVALAGSFSNLDAIIDALDPWWPAAPDEVRLHWQRDRRLLTVARNAREQRRARAWSALSTR